MKINTKLIISILLITSGSLLAQPRNFCAEGAKLVTAKEYQAAAKVFHEGVNADDAASMDYMGWLYLEGKGVRKSLDIAEGYFREAAALGNAQSCRNLGNMYYDGRAGEPSTPEAAKWWQLATERGALRATFSLATVLYTGTGIQRDQTKAYALWREASKNGDKPSGVALIYVQAQGDLNKIDPAQLKPLADNGCQSAKFLLRAVELQNAKHLDAYIDLPFEPQAYNFCAIASTTMLLKSTGLKLTHFDLAQKRPNHQWNHGARWPVMVKAAAKYNCKLSIHSFPYTNEGFEKGVAELIDELNHNRPAVVDLLDTTLFPNAHSILLIGYSQDTGEFIFRDSAMPFPGIRVLTTPRFKELWRSKGFIPKNETLLRPYMKSEVLKF